MPAVSIIIPTFNRADTIEASIRSVLQQTFPDFELIVVDDASTDATVAAVSAIEDPRLTLVRAPVNGGGARARNLGLERATAPLVAFQDSDDFWLPDKLANQMRRMAGAAPGCVGTFCSFIYLTGTRATLLPRDTEIPAEEVSLTLFRRNLISTQTLLARRPDLEAIGGFDPEMPRFQDWELCIRLARRGTILHDPVPGVVVRAMPNSISTRYEAGLDARRRIIALCQRLDAPIAAQAAQRFDLGARLLAIGQMQEAATCFREARRLGGGMRPLAGLALSWLPSGLVRAAAGSVLARRDGVLR
ncbi:glycosyltransferase family 2 protein [Inquilinus limosus]|uniref:glycosyltransferase family 2 protein n=1 Tax=Inquilinus limosus TaxID=171674 RepID=UPI00068B7423|nr:glycosyltransferase family A protein [Inquilinus limosus]